MQTTPRYVCVKFEWIPCSGGEVTFRTMIRAVEMLHPAASTKTNTYRFPFHVGPNYTDDVHIRWHKTTLKHIYTTTNACQMYICKKEVYTCTTLDCISQPNSSNRNSANIVLNNFRTIKKHKTCYYSCLLSHLVWIGNNYNIPNSTLKHITLKHLGNNHQYM